FRCINRQKEIRQMAMLKERLAERIDHEAMEHGGIKTTNNHVQDIHTLTPIDPEEYMRTN
ncbi:hypothetical protein CO044_03110, partial [Candidatus Peregrinibacteria bacterium CG_4_9_14_0_2_um_filter_38_9]